MRLYILSVLIMTSSMVSGQLSFPNGTVLNLNTTADYMYNETGIYFHTGKNKITDYQWTKVLADSLDPRWDLEACMNGDCKIGLPVQGVFIADFGLNDTTGFIKFHVTTSGFSGASTLSYIVSHKVNATDKATLQFYIHYTNAMAVNDADALPSFEVYPNPVSDYLRIKNRGGKTGKVMIVQADGKVILTIALTGDLLQEMDLRTLSSGMYFLEVHSQNRITHSIVQVN